MKKIFSLTILFCAFITLAHAQPPAKEPMSEENQKHQKNQTLPSFNISRMDSTVFNTKNIPNGTKIMIVVFSPTCEHCEKFTRRLLAGMDSLKSINFYFVSPIRDEAVLKRFYNNFNLAQYPNIKIVGRDLEFFAMDFYSIRHFPWPVLYDEHKKLLRVFENEATVTDICEYLH